MINRDRASDNEVVLAFLRAEIESPKPKLRQQYEDCLQRRGLDRARLIDGAELTDEKVNRDRKAVLGEVRGFGRDMYLFQGFPTDTAWRRVLVEAADFDRLKCISIDPQMAQADSRNAPDPGSRPQFCRRYADGANRPRHHGGGRRWRGEQSGQRPTPLSRIGPLMPASALRH